MGVPVQRSLNFGIKGAVVKSPLGTVANIASSYPQRVAVPDPEGVHRVGLHSVCRDPAVDPVILLVVLGDSSRATL